VEGADTLITLGCRVVTHGLALVRAGDEFKRLTFGLDNS
jgi:hypothetical protein